jgi:hypothetical protein
MFSKVFGKSKKQKEAEELALQAVSLILNGHAMA